MLGFDRESRLVNLDDTAELTAYLTDADDAPVAAADIASVEFTVQKPNGDFLTFPGAIHSDGGAYLAFNQTDMEGEYLIVARFTLTTGVVRSQRADFSVQDIFTSDHIQSAASLQDWVGLPTDDARRDWMTDTVASRVWDKMEDLFDSNDGGPWMRDMTLNVFSSAKIPDFIDEALLDINVYNPPSAFWVDEFATPLFISGQSPRQNPNLGILVQGTWVAVIRHLMRSYAEQPAATGGQITYEDRRDYLQRWGTIYQIEFQFYDHLVKMWKRQFLGLGQSKQLVANKAGRLMPAPLRARNVGRGYY